MYNKIITFLLQKMHISLANTKYSLTKIKKLPKHSLPLNPCKPRVYFEDSEKVLIRPSSHLHPIPLKPLDQEERWE